MKFENLKFISSNFKWVMRVDDLTLVTIAFDHAIVPQRFHTTLEIGRCGYLFCLSFLSFRFFSVSSSFSKLLGIALIYNNIHG